MPANNSITSFNGSRINPTRGVIDIRANRADAEYNSLETEVSRQFSRGLFFRVAYMHGEDLDDASDVVGSFARLLPTLGPLSQRFGEGLGPLSLGSPPLHVV